MNNIIEKGIKEKLISFDKDYKYITYLAQNKKRNYSNPEEEVQAEAYLKLILDYGYPKEHIGLFVSLTTGSSRKEADIVVYKDKEHTQPYIVVECKNKEVSDKEFNQAVEQASSYAYFLSGSIKYIWVVSSIEKSFKLDKDNDIKLTIPDIPRYGKSSVSKYKYVKGGKLSSDEVLDTETKKNFFDLETINESKLTQLFKQAHNALWAGGALNPSSAFDELDKLIFCKIWDERKLRKNGQPYDFQIFSEEMPTFSKDTPKEVIDAKSKELEEKASKELLKRIKALYEEGRKKDPEVFKDDIRLDYKKVKTVVSYLEKVNLGATDLDSKGKAFETFMGSYFRGDFGQFFTPRNIVKFIVNVLPITHESRVMDTSCGSGGFLLYALNKVREEASEYFEEGTDKHFRHWHDFAEKKLFGIEINEQISRTAKMNMIIHDDGHTNVITSDGLVDSANMIQSSGNRGFKYNSFDFIITNPPFGSSIKQTEAAYLNQYGLGIKKADWKAPKEGKDTDRANQSTEVLFIEQDYKFLKEGGFLAIVVPDGVLTNSSMQYVRDSIEEWFRIVAVVSMPQTAFAHTGAGVKSSVLFLRKWSKETTEEIKHQKKILQDEAKEKLDFFNLYKKSEKAKKDEIKKYEGDKKSDEFKEWKKELNEKYKIEFEKSKEELEDYYLVQKQATLKDYSIFMAIADDIGFDATGRSTGNNELDIIQKELTKFINHIIEVE